MYARSAADRRAATLDLPPPDPADAGEAFRAAHGFVPVNHLLVARSDIAREHPKAMAELVRPLFA